MAIAYDAATGRQVAASSTSLSFSHTCTGTDRALFVSVLTNNTADDVTGVTYNGVAMTRVTHSAGASTYHCYLYVLANPASGANNVVISTGTARNIFGGAVSYTGVDQTTPAEGTPATNTTASATTLSQSVTTLTDNAWVFASAHWHGSPNLGGAGTDTTSRLTGNSSDYAGAVDSGGVVTPAGSRSLEITSSSAQQMTMCVTAVKPAGATVEMNFLTLLGAG